MLLVRHGEVETRYHRVFGGRIDMDLSDLGHTQARAVAACLRRHQPRRVYLSPMKRARQTAAPFLADSGLEPVVVDELREVDFGAWTGLGWEDVRTRFGVSAFEWLRQLDANAIPEAEPAEAFRARTASCLARVLTELEDHTVAVICHGGVIRMMLSLLLDIPVVRTAHFDIEYGSVSIIDPHPSRTELRLLNHTPWREHP